MSYRFWKRIHDYARKKMRYAWDGLNLRCPHCNTWWSDVGDYGYSPGGNIDTMTCHQCGKDSYWMNEGLIAWSVPKPKSDDTI